MQQAFGSRTSNRCLSRTSAPSVSLAPAPRRSRQLRLQVLLHGATKVDPNSEKFKGFVNDMRVVAMKLHTKDQATEGGKPAQQTRVWTPSVEGYVKFLAESKVVYDTLETIIAQSSNSDYVLLRSSGLERSAALAKDLAWFKDVKGIPTPGSDPSGPGATYSAQLEELAISDPPAFICHYYNFYFAHTAGRRMIGSKLAQMLLDNQQLEFYRWDGDVQQLLDNVRRKINQMAEGWSPEQKTHCLEVTEQSFKYSGVIMQCISMAH